MSDFYFIPRTPFSFSLKLIVALLLLSQSQAWAQTATPSRLTPNLPRQAINTNVVGNKPPASVPGAAGPMNHVRTDIPRVAITSEERVLKGSVDSVQVSITYFDGLGRPLQTVVRQESPLKRDVVFQAPSRYRLVY
jgi:hypothetical protein